MKIDDLTNCEFIQEYLRFVTYNDFCKNCNAIKHYYIEFNSEGKRLYKWYIYANVYLNENQKNAIWNFLNSDEPDYLNKLLFFASKKK